MLIGFDGRSFATGRIEGMMVYNKNLLTRLSQDYPLNEYHLFFNSLTKDYKKIGFLDEQENVKKIVMRIPTTGFDRVDTDLFFSRSLPLYLRKRKIDLFHGLQYFVPPEGRAKVVTTFHDLFALILPELHSSRIIDFRRHWYKLAIERSKLIISVSQSTKNDLMKYFNIAEDKIRVIHHGIADNFGRVTDQGRLAEVKSKYNLHYPFILALGGRYGRKNNAQLIRAHSLLVQKGVSDIKLVFFGGAPGLIDVWGHLINSLGLDGKVHFIYPIADDDLPTLYSLAQLFVYPSLYEGFGIPILEAMKCGTPVITSNVSSMPEVAGDAALLINPTDVNDLTSAILKMLNHSELRQAYREKGLRRAAQFGWDKAVKETVRVYEEALQI